jgi:hypothetical protein
MIYLSEVFLFNLAKWLALWVVYLFFVAVGFQAINKWRREKMQRILELQYEEASILYEESGELEKARQCGMLADYVEFNQQYG